MQWLPFALWPLLATGWAYIQGILMPAIRRTPPGPEADRQDVALHRVGWLVYFLPWGFAPTVPLLVTAALSRLLLFDPVLNLAAHRPAFEVGQTAAFDKLLRKLAPGQPDRLRFMLWLGCWALAGVGAWLFLR